MKINLPDQAKLLRNFARCHDWEERYLYLIELGEKLPALTETQRIAQHNVFSPDNSVRTYFAHHIPPASDAQHSAADFAAQRRKLPFT